MKVLVTGGGGFIGSHLVESQLENGHAVTALDLHGERLSHLDGHPRLSMTVGDITSGDTIEQVVEGVDVVYHLASAHLEISMSNHRYRQVNVDATLNLLRAAQSAGVKRVVHCSSVGVFGEISKPPVDETAPCHPTTIYEQTKLDGERAALAYADRTGLPVVVVRPAWVYGPGCPRTRKLFRSIQKGRFVMVGDGKTLRHPIYVTDLVKGMERCAKADNVEGRVYILAGEEPIMVGALARTIAEVCGIPWRALHIPVALGKVAGIATQTVCKPLGFEPPFSRRSVDFFVKDNAYDTSRARRELAFRPEVGLREGLTRTLQWLSG